MKKIYTLLLTTIFCTATLATEQPITSKNTVILTDADDVLLDKTFGLNTLAQLQPLEALVKSKKSTNISPDVPEKKSAKLNGFTLRMLDYGRRYPRFASYTPGLIEYVGKSRCINQPMYNLYKHLKDEGYPIIIATNKDRMLYNLAIEALGDEIPNMVDKVFVAEPVSDAAALAQLQAFADKPTTSAKYKVMARKVLTTQGTDKIIHIPSKKPAQEYFIYAINNIGSDKNIIFIDDNKENVDTFNALQKDSSYLRRGIIYDKSNPQQFTQELINLGLVSEMRDKKLLDDIRYPGMWGKIKLGFKSLFEPQHTQTQPAE